MLLEIFVALVFVVLLLYFVVKSERRIDDLNEKIESLKLSISILEKKIRAAAPPETSKTDVRAETAKAREAMLRPEIRAVAAMPETEKTAAEPAAKSAAGEQEGMCEKPFSRRLYEFAVSRIFPWLGGLAVILSGFFLAKYSVERGLFPPEMRVISTGILAAALCAFAEFLRAKNGAGTLSGIFFASGIAIAYGDFYAAGEFYSMISGKCALAGAAAVSLAAGFSVRRHGSGMFYLAAVGALLAPAVFNAETHSAALLAAYLLIFNAILIGFAKNSPRAMFCLALGNIFWLWHIFWSGGYTESANWVFAYMLFVSFAFVLRGRVFGGNFIGLEKYSYLKFFARYGQLIFSVCCASYALSHGEFAREYPHLQAAFGALAGLAILASKKSPAMRIVAVAAVVLLARSLSGGAWACAAVALAALPAAKLFISDEGIYPIALISILFASVFCCEPPRCMVFSGIFALLMFAIFYAARRPSAGAGQIIVAASVLAAIWIFVQFEANSPTALLCYGGAALLGSGLGRVFKDESFDWCARAMLAALAFSLAGGNYSLFWIRDYQAYLPKTAYYLAASASIFAALLFTRGECSAEKKIFGVAGVLVFAYFSMYFAFLVSGNFYPKMYFLSRSAAAAALGVAAVLARFCAGERRCGIAGGARAALIFMVLYALGNSAICITSKLRVVHVEGYPLLNSFMLSLLVPAFCAACFALFERGAFKVAARIAAAMLFFAFANFELRFCFQGNVVNAAASSAEWYSYSVLWIAFGALFAYLGRRRTEYGYFSLAVVLGAIFKVFVLDAASLDGLLRVLSFAMLGAALILTGWSYSKLIGGRGEKKP